MLRSRKVLDDAWLALHGRLWEYVVNSASRKADWTPAKLQLAIHGALSTRIFYHPTNSMVSAIASYGANVGRRAELLACTPNPWGKKDNAKKHMVTTPIYRQLVGEAHKRGKRRSGPAADAMNKAGEPYEIVNSIADGYGEGSDNPLNHAFAFALDAALPDTFDVYAEQPHPWIPGVRPDVRVDTPDGNHICIEICYTNRRADWVVADYVLRKLLRYMKNLENLIVHQIE